MIVVSTTMARYPSRGSVLGYLKSWRRPNALPSPLRTGAVTAVVVIVHPLTPRTPML